MTQPPWPPGGQNWWDPHWWKNPTTGDWTGEPDIGRDF
jgi:hypothetical protein